MEHSSENATIYCAFCQSGPFTPYALQVHSSICTVLRRYLNLAQASSSSHVAENQNHEGESESPQTSPNVAVLMDQICVAVLDVIERSAMIDRMLDMMISLLAKDGSHDNDDAAQS
ncbi:hypothetical protein LguiA_023568 [Lonicera macranthoides]